MTDLSGFLGRARCARYLLVLALVSGGFYGGGGSATAQEPAAAVSRAAEPKLQAGDPASTLADQRPIVPAGTSEIRPPRAGILPVNLSPWGMFLAADIVVKAVMVGLAFASVVTWTVWLA